MAVNNAGIQAPPTDAAHEPAELFDRINAVNLRGIWTCMKHERRQMRTQGSGATVNNSSLVGLVGLPGRAAHHASKHGVIRLTKCAALEYAPRGIRPNAICRGRSRPRWSRRCSPKANSTRTKPSPTKSVARLGQASETAAAVLWLCSPGANVVLGVGHPADGG